MIETTSRGRIFGGYSIPTRNTLDVGKSLAFRMTSMNNTVLHPSGQIGGLSQAVPERICLIIPPSLFLLDDRVFMSLGILRVAAVLEAAGVQVDVLDLSGIANFTMALLDYASTAETTLFGVTATTPQLPPTVEIVQALRNARPDAKIILGGPHATLVNAAYKAEKTRHAANGRGALAMRQLTEFFDVVVAGDGEEAIFAACHPEAPKIIDADERGSPMFLSNDRLDTLPWPARHLVDVESYHYSIEGFAATSLIAQLGCPFNCGFCGGRASPMLRNIRTRTSANIVAELEHVWRTTGRTGFMFYDDELNVSKSLVELMRLIARKQRQLGVEWRFRGFIKSQLFTVEQAQAMYAAGFRWILVGFESGSEKILTNINKQSTRDENTRCMEIARRHGLKVKALMSIGHPGESLETVEDTRKWLLEVKPADFDVTVITCYPGTPYFDQAVPQPGKDGVWVYTFKRTGDRLFQIALDYATTADHYKGIPGDYHCYVYTDTLRPEDLVRERDRVESSVRQELGIPFVFYTGYSEDDAFRRWPDVPVVSKPVGDGVLLDTVAGLLH